MEDLSKALTEKYIKEHNIYHINVCDKTTSTNSVLKEMAKKGAPEMSVLIAGCQTDGRGRMGRSFYSPSGAGIYMSILLKPVNNAVSLVNLTACAAVVCAEVLEEVSGKNTLIKWVNDIYISDRKVCGILAETSFEGVNKSCVLGIGINVFSPEGGYPAELKDRAGALFDSACNVSRSEIAAKLLDKFSEYYDSLNHVLIDKKYFLEKYRNRSMIPGKEIYVIRNGSSVNAKANAIDDDFSLIVTLQSGKTERLSYGEVSIKKKRAASPISRSIYG